MPRDIAITLGKREALLREGLYRALLNSILSRRADPARDGLVVDVGAGRGELLRLLRDRDIDCLGVDPEAECVEEARKHGPCVLGGVGDLHSVLGGQRPDIIVCSHVLEHLRDPAGALEIMRDSGAQWFVFAVPNVHRASRMLRVALGGRRADHPTHIFGWGLAEFRALLREMGFEIVGWRVDRVTLSPLSGEIGAWATRRLRPLEERWLPAVAPNLSSSLIAECRLARKV